MDFDIQFLVWNDWNTDHVTKHGASQVEVESVCYGAPIKYKESYMSRVLVIGHGASDRSLTVLLGEVPDSTGGIRYPFSARPADRRERAFYVATRRTK